MADKVLVAHSLAEAYLYLMVTPCPTCGKGPMKGDDAQPIQSREPAIHVTILARCAACEDACKLTFHLPDGTLSPGGGQTAVFSATDSPSDIIDVAQWVTLFRTIAERATRETDKIQARHLGIEAAQCLDEAMKFYTDPDNDLPPAEAMFHEASRERFRLHPEQFSKQRLVNLRAKLPSLTTMRTSLAARPPKKKPWWRSKR